MKKDKFSRYFFINLGKLKLQMNMQIFWHVQRPMPKRLTGDFSDKILIHKHSDDLHEIDNRIKKKRERLPKIPVAYALFTIFKEL